MKKFLQWWRARRVRALRVALAGAKANEAAQRTTYVQAETVNPYRMGEMAERIARLEQHLRNMGESP